jgi:hypothetical protein
MELDRDSEREREREREREESATTSTRSTHHQRVTTYPHIPQSLFSDSPADQLQPACPSELFYQGPHPPSVYNSFRPCRAARAPVAGPARGVRLKLVRLV